MTDGLTMARYNLPLITTMNDELMPNEDLKALALLLAHATPHVGVTIGDKIRE